MNFAITCILQRLSSFNVLGVSHEELEREISKFKPDILIFEIEKNEKKNVSLLEKIRITFPELKTLVLIDNDDKEFIIELLKYNFEGYLLKNTSKEELIFATNKIFKGEIYYNDNISKFVMTNMSQKQKKKAKSKDTELSIREKEILEHIILGRKNNEIAKILCISDNTVLTHRRNIMKKLRVKSTPQLIAKSIRDRIISFPYN